MPNEKVFNDKTIRDIREAERKAYEEMRKALWPFPTQTWEQRCAMLEAARRELCPSADDSTDEPLSR